MSLSLGQLLGGAGVVGQAWRAEEDAWRRSKEAELRLAELERLDRFRQEALGLSLPNLDEFSVTTSQLPLEVVSPISFQAPTASVAPAARTNRATPAAPTASVAPAARTNRATPAAPAAPVAPATSGAPITKAQTPPVVPQPPALTRSLPPVQPVMSQIEADRLALLRVPTAVLDVFQAPVASTLNIATAAGETIVNAGGRLINAITGRAVAPTNVKGPRWSLTPFYDRYVRQPEQAAMRAAQTQQLAQLPSAKEQSQAQSTDQNRALNDPFRAFIDPLVQSIIKVESNGNPNAVSSIGAIGLGQIRPTTAINPGYGVSNIFDVAKELGVSFKARNEEEAKRLLFNPKVNEEFTRRYISRLINHYGGNVEYALMAYNWGPANVDNWIKKANANPGSVPFQVRDYVTKVLGKTKLAATGTPQSTTVPGLAIPSVTQPAAQPVNLTAKDFYLANPESIPVEIQRAMQQRNELAQMAEMFRRAGMGMQFMELRTKLLEADNNILYLHGMQGIQELTLARDPRRLAAVWSRYAGMPINIQPRSDGLYNVIVNGRQVKTGVSSDNLVAAARPAFDAAYRQQAAAASAELNKKIVETQLKIMQDRAAQEAQMIREIFVEKTKGNYELAKKRLEQEGYKIVPSNDTSGTIYIISGDNIYVYDPRTREVKIDGVNVTVPPSVRELLIPRK